MGRGLRYYDTYLHVLHLRSRRGAPASRRSGGGRVRRDPSRDGAALRAAGGGRAMSERAARIALGVLMGLAVVVALATDLPRVSEGPFLERRRHLPGDVREPRLRSRPALRARGPRAGADRLPRGAPGALRQAGLRRRRGHAPGLRQGARVPAGRGALRAAPGRGPGPPAPERPVPVASPSGSGTSSCGGRAKPGPALAGVVAVILLGVVPVYLLWLTPEIFNLALLAAGLVAWRSGRPGLAAVLFGIAAYSKPTNALVALPLLLDPLFGAGPWRRRRGDVRPPRPARGGGDGAGLRRDLARHRRAQLPGRRAQDLLRPYPFDPGVTFDSAGVWMTTDHVGPLVAGRDDAKHTERVAPPRPPEELRRSFVLNLGYFWIGRFGGAVAYFPGVVLAGARPPRRRAPPRGRAGWRSSPSWRRGWPTSSSSPTTGTAGPAPSGNRYFVNLVPLGLLLLPRGRGPWVALGAAVVTGGRCSRPSSRRRCGTPGSPAPTRPARSSGSSRPSSRCSATSRSSPTSGASAGRTTRREATRRAVPRGARRRTSCGSSTTAPSGRRPRSTRRASGSAGERTPRWFSRPSRLPPPIRLVVTAGPAGDIVTVRLGAGAPAPRPAAAAHAGARAEGPGDGAGLLRDEPVSVFASARGTAGPPSATIATSGRSCGSCFSDPVIGHYPSPRRGRGGLCPGTTAAAWRPWQAGAGARTGPPEPAPPPIQALARWAPEDASTALHLGSSAPCAVARRGAAPALDPGRRPTGCRPMDADGHRPPTRSAPHVGGGDADCQTLGTRVSQGDSDGRAGSCSPCGAGRRGRG